MVGRGRAAGTGRRTESEPGVAAMQAVGSMLGVAVVERSDGSGCG